MVNQSVLLGDWLVNLAGCSNWLLVSVANQAEAQSTVSYAKTLSQSVKGNSVLNVSNILHDPNEVERKSIDEIKFEWNSIK